MTTLKEVQDTLQKTLADTQAERNIVNQALTALQAQIASLQKDIAGLQAQIAGGSVVTQEDLDAIDTAVHDIDVAVASIYSSPTT